MTYFIEKILPYFLSDVQFIYSVEFSCLGSQATHVLQEKNENEKMQHGIYVLIQGLDCVHVCICSLIVKGAKYGLDAIAVWSVPASLAQISGIPTFSGQDFDMAFHFSKPQNSILPGVCFEPKIKVNLAGM